MSALSILYQGKYHHAVDLASIRTVHTFGGYQYNTFGEYHYSSIGKYQNSTFVDTFTATRCFGKYITLHTIHFVSTSGIGKYVYL